MSKKAGFSFLGVFLFLFLFNIFTPMYFGDDYVYSFIWEGHSLYEPLSDNPVRVSSWKDLFASQWLHFMTWSGRTVNHTLAQFFLWKGKALFNVYNALAGTLLVAEIYWCTHKGEVTKQFRAGTIYWILFLLWSFTPAFGTVFLWLDGACNYLWPMVLLTGFSVPYIKKYYSFSNRIGQSRFFGPSMFVLGLLAGWTNENTICWIIPVLLLFLITHKKDEKVELWMYYGLAGLIAGYALLMFAPGNMVRLYAEQKGDNWLAWERIKDRLSLFGFILCYFQVFLWYFILRALYSLKNRNKGDTELNKELLLVKLLCIVAFGMSAIMLFSPGFPPRSGFPGTVCLVIAAGILMRVQNEYTIILIQENAKKFLVYMSVLYFAMTTFVAFTHYYEKYEYVEDIITSAKHMKTKDTVLEIKPEKELTLKEHIMSAYHISSLGLADDENEWKNVSFARYYGIKGIRVKKDKSDENIENN